MTTTRAHGCRATNRSQPRTASETRKSSAPAPSTGRPKLTPSAAMVPITAMYAATAPPSTGPPLGASAEEDPPADDDEGATRTRATTGDHVGWARRRKATTYARCPEEAGQPADERALGVTEEEDVTGEEQTSATRIHRPTEVSSAPRRARRR